MPNIPKVFLACILCSSTLPVIANDAVRARSLGIPFEGKPGALNAITDVAGVAVGQVTLVQDLPDGRKVRTGVSAILPRGKASYDTPAFGAWFALNGNGEMTGTAWLDESGQLEGPVLLTNTHSVGVVRDAAIAHRVRAGGADASGYWWSLPIVAETWDGHLNDINGFHVRPEIAGVPVGQHLRGDRVYSEPDPKAGDTGSIIIVVATDAPLLPHQLKRIAKRAGMGLARMGSYVGNGSGDMQGRDGHYAKAIPHDQLVELIKRYNRLERQH